jgi:hypothetical protein
MREIVRQTAEKPGHVFLNLPFDSGYAPLRCAVLFAVSDCGFIPRCALEENDSGEVRFQKIVRMIAECPLAIHDISRTEPDSKTKLPRFNMPFEAGVFIAAGIFGKRAKNCLILDRQQYRHQKFFSDLAGNDIAAHGGRKSGAIAAVRDFLNHYSKSVPQGGDVAKRFARFFRKYGPLKLNYLDYMNALNIWLDENDRA